MKLAPGFLLRTAPHFHPRSGWQDGLEVCSGAEPTASGFFPRLDWRRATDEEISLLVGAAPQAASDDMLSPERAGFFSVPNHLRAAWWQAADGIDENGAASAYENFVAQTVEFLRFKDLPLPESCSFDVRVSQPGRRSTRLDPTASYLCGLGFGATAEDASRRMVAWVNLGDEEARLVFLNLTAPMMRRLADQAGRFSPPQVRQGDLLQRFVASVPDYPLVRLRCEPGEGLWFPAAAVLWDGDTQDKLDLDVILTLTTSDAAVA